VTKARRIEVDVKSGMKRKDIIKAEVTQI